MKDLKDFIIKIVISVIVLAFAFIYLDKKPTTTNSIQFPVRTQDNSPATPSQLKWHDNFKGIENVPSKPKVQPTENK